MKTITTRIRMILLAVLSLSGLALLAQDNSQNNAPQKYRLYLIKDENGNKDVIDKTFSSKEEMDAYIKDNKIDVPDEDAIVKVSAPGKVVYIKNNKDNNGEDVEISEMPEPPAPPAAPGAPCPGQKSCDKKCTKKIIIIEKDESSNSGKTNLQITTQELSPDDRAKVVQQLIDMKIGDVQLKEVSGDAGASVTIKEKPGSIGEVINESGDNLSGLKVFPNPSNGQFHIEFQVAKPTDIKFRITDSEGKQVYADALSNYSGKFEKEINNLGSSKGTYVMDVEAGAEKKTLSVIMQ